MTLNTSSVVGRLGKDIELRKTGSGKSVASFSLAVNDSYNKETTYWIDCVAWGKAGEILAQYTHKGSKIGVSGRLQTRDWEDKSGGKHKATEINVQDFELLDSKSEGQSNNNQVGGWGNADPFGGKVEPKESDLPF